MTDLGLLSGATPHSFQRKFRHCGNPSCFISFQRERVPFSLCRPNNSIHFLTPNIL